MILFNIQVDQENNRLVITSNEPDNTRKFYTLFKLHARSTGFDQKMRYNEQTNEIYFDAGQIEESEIGNIPSPGVYIIDKKVTIWFGTTELKDLFVHYFDGLKKEADVNTYSFTNAMLYFTDFNSPRSYEVDSEKVEGPAEQKAEFEAIRKNIDQIHQQFTDANNLLTDVRLTEILERYPDPAPIEAPSFAARPNISMMILGGFITVLGITAIAVGFAVLNVATFGVAGLVLGSIGIAATLSGIGIFAGGIYNKSHSPSDDLLESSSHLITATV